ncbi:MAG: hypothetical protein HZB65_04075 [Candidatus Aenigmarchaeota archaeon]|nr:hypothetical protein [Candidatus Aenigmarchaeota archaeon]
MSLTNLSKLAKRLKGWNTLDDIAQKLGIAGSTARFYAYVLNKNNFIVQKIYIRKKITFGIIMKL